MLYEPYPKPKPKAGPRKSKPKPAKARKIDFTPAVPTPKRASKDARTGMEMPKQVKPKRSYDDAVRTQKNQRELLKEMMIDTRSRNVLRARKKRGM